MIETIFGIAANDKVRPDNILVVPMGENAKEVSQVTIRCCFFAIPSDWDLDPFDHRSWSCGAEANLGVTLCTVVLQPTRMLHSHPK